MWLIAKGLKSVVGYKKYLSRNYKKNASMPFIKKDMIMFIEKRKILVSVFFIFIQIANSFAQELGGDLKTQLDTLREPLLDLLKFEQDSSKQDVEKSLDGAWQAMEKFSDVLQQDGSQEISESEFIEEDENNAYKNEDDEDFFGSEPNVTSTPTSIVESKTLPIQPTTLPDQISTKSEATQTPVAITAPQVPVVQPVVLPEKASANPEVIPTPAAIATPQVPVAQQTSIPEQASTKPEATPTPGTATVSQVSTSQSTILPEQVPAKGEATEPTKTEGAPSGASVISQPTEPVKIDQTVSTSPVPPVDLVAPQIQGAPSQPETTQQVPSEPVKPETQGPVAQPVATPVAAQAPMAVQ